jgi:hypothetical protein
MRPCGHRRISAFLPPSLRRASHYRSMSSPRTSEHDVIAAPGAAMAAVHHAQTLAAQTSAYDTLAIDAKNYLTSLGQTFAPPVYPNRLIGAADYRLTVVEADGTVVLDSGKSFDSSITTPGGRARIPRRGSTALLTGKTRPSTKTTTAALPFWRHSSGLVVSVPRQSIALRAASLRTMCRFVCW